jgi:hypothetical protein
MWRCSVMLSLRRSRFAEIFLGKAKRTAGGQHVQE